MKNQIHFKHVLVAGACVALGFSSLLADPVNQVSYGSLTGTALINFEDLAHLGAPGTNYNGIFESGGANFAERFVGQTLSYSGDSDILSATTTGALTLQVGAANQNINIFDYGTGFGNVLDGLGKKGYPNFDGIGEGSFAVLFDFDQSEFGFRLLGGNGGMAEVNFFARSGTLISSITLSGLSDTYYGFSRNGGVEDIAGISIHNTDLGGIGFDDLKHSKQGIPGDPVPDAGSTSLMLGSVLAGLALLRRRSVR